MNLRHRLFAYLLLLRAPIEGEQADIDSALAWVRAKAGWLLLAYVVMLGFNVLPVFVESHGTGVRAVAIVGTHLTFWFYAFVAAICWVGFRGYTADGGRLPLLVLLLLVLWVSLAALFLPEQWNLGRDLKAWSNSGATFLWNTISYVAAIIIVPTVVVRARRREQAATTRALQAEAAGERLARKTTEAELRLLQAQVEPHFLYNTLANLRYLIQKDSANALRMTDALIEYLRTSVPDIRSLRVPLGRETDHAGHYLEIMQMRMGDRLTFSIDVPDELRAVEVPPLLLLTLVENAIKHGVAPRIEGGAVLVRAAAVGAVIELEVADTGVGIDGRATAINDAPSTGVGLENLRGRLELVYGTPIKVELSSNVPRGTRVLFRLPREMPRSEAESTAVQVRAASADGASTLPAPNQRGLVR